MKYLILSVLAALLLISCGSDKTPAAKADASMAKPESHAQTDGEKMIYFTCPMESHKHIHSTEPGSCSECNMALIPAVITSEDEHEFYGCPMEIHSHVRQAAPGRCAECNMELKPMRLKRSA
ncbi:MAG: hypothetical protein L3J79_05060 [Candidatus Marinimicrobia bacterium]|nr:hypothetical protein [Candidatus Neomarinimicrobiota bacterium]